MQQLDQPSGYIQPRPAASLQSATSGPHNINPFETDALKEWHRTIGQTRESSLLASTVRYSTDGESQRPRNSPSRAFLESVVQARRATNQTPALSTAVRSEAALQSATDLATSSVASLTDLQAYEQHLQEAHSLIGSVVREMATAEDAHDPIRPLSPTQSNTPQRSSRARSNASPKNPAGSQGSLPKAIPSALRKLAPQLLALQQHLASQPSISSTMQNISDRLWMLENASFQHLPAEEINEKFELMDGRILDTEQRLNELEHQYYVMQEEKEEKERAEAESQQDEVSGSKSILAKVLDETDKLVRLSEIEQRLEDLEAAVPSDANPWEIEVVLLPWGRDLRGIWYPEGELAQLAASSQKPADSRSRRQLPTSSPPSKAIQLLSRHSEADEKLFPRACGSKGKVWHRLRSRGFVKTVTIKDPAARHILTSISEAFGDDILRNERDLSQLTTDSEISDLSQESFESPPFVEYTGLRAPVIPLRKVRRDNQLLFMGQSDLVTPSLWDIQFLSSGMIHFASGKRRLFVTTPDAYLQTSNDSTAWTWPMINNMPRVDISLPAAADNEAQISDDDYEPWWEWHPDYDQLDYPSSVNPSDDSQSPFGSASPKSMPLRPSQESPWGTCPANVSAGRAAQYTPESQPPPRPPRPFRRTVSAPTTQVTTCTSPRKRRADGAPADSDESGSDVTLSEFVSHMRKESNKRRCTSRSISKEDVSSRGSDETATAGVTRKFLGQQFTPCPTPSTESNLPFLAQGGEMDLRNVGASAKPNSQRRPSNRGSDAYATPQATCSPGGVELDASDTERDCASSDDGAHEDSDESDHQANVGAEARTHRNVRNKKRTTHIERDMHVGHGDEEMSDTHDEWNGITSDDPRGESDVSQNPGSVDFIGSPEIKQESNDELMDSKMYGHPPLPRPPVAYAGSHIRRGGRL
ncbi:hypothetical protein MPH_00152 [Macrophomina phaseolina MS6]|uniref:Uncharacterized protein n=1 Tax=Macrophomina phaseolina (strain MS6) TaxID=1126212 RepID=K2S672_MACPH|nr:hypothetical protein MPH_00152 [Macrophomina phaseolina MS6]